MGAPTINHLQFADDTLLFCDAKVDQLLNVKAILLCFGAVSGLKVNFFKSELLDVHIPDFQLEYLADILGCKVGSFPCTYLGLPLCTGVVSPALWNTVIDRVDKRLASWKALLNGHMVRCV